MDGGEMVPIDLLGEEFPGQTSMCHCLRSGEIVLNYRMHNQHEKPGLVC